MYKFSKNDIPQDWHVFLGDYFESSHWHQLQENIQTELDLHPKCIRPDPEHFFKALQLTPLDSVRVVILGQDPYHSPGLAQGLAFSIPADIPINSRQFPSSLRNISKALALEGFGTLSSGDLQNWAKQGVLLLNTALSVRLGEAGSHTGLGWQFLIDRLIAQLALTKPNLVWMLWGGHAQSKLPLLESASHALILESSHPSGLGVYKTTRPFLQAGGMASCGHFTKTNNWLLQHQQAPIRWVIDADERPVRVAQANLFS